MKFRAKLNPLARLWPALAALCFPASRGLANPEGMTVAAGNVTAVQNGAQLNITASQNAVINWSSFNIGANETTTFQQPNHVSVVWNRIADANPSQIWGHLNANGIVVLMNQNGFYFGPNSSVNVGGFVAAGAMVTPPASVGGAMWTYQGPPPAASIINYGEIKANNGGSIFMIAEKIENHGILSAPDGTLGLYAGKEVMISERPDGRGLSANVALPDGTIDNLGKISADAGTIALHARVVNQDGMVQANSIRNRNGVIELFASDAVNLGANSQIQANGDASGASAGGEVAIKAANTFSDGAGSQIQVRGGATGGDGGAVEISAANMTAVKSRIDGTAATGSRGGKLLLDPADIEFSSPNSSSTGLIPGALQYNVSQDFVGLSQIQLQATHDILMDPGTVWSLDDLGTTGNLLTLQAGHNIIFGDQSGIAGGNGWSVQLLAGADLSATPDANGLYSATAVISGRGGIYLNGNASTGNYVGADGGNGRIETADGDAMLLAGHEVMVGSGSIRTGYNYDPYSATEYLMSPFLRGGNILITTRDGDVNAGSAAATYDFNSRGYVISGLGLGGIGTANGGNVSINAGRDLVSIGANVGAFGANAGDVSLAAGRDLIGGFMLRNGTGTARAGRDIGTSSIGDSFGLVKGTWNVAAGWDPIAQSIVNGQGNLFLNEIYNPNGALNNQRVNFGAKVQFQYDYAANATVNLASGHSVQLLGNNLAQTADNAGRSAIYAPILNIATGAGGVTLGNDVILFPSTQGRLTVTTTDGGSLRSSPGGFFEMIVSDSGSAKYNTFASDHAATPLHLGAPLPVVQFDISGNLQNVYLGAPGYSDIRVHGNAVNFSFVGQNLAANQTTRLQIDGDFSTRSDHTVATLSDVINADFLVSPDINDPSLVVNQALIHRLTYNPTTHQLDIQGVMTEADLNYLLHPMKYLWDPVVGLHLDAQGNPIIVPATFTTDTAALQELYAASQDIPTSPLASAGMQLGGPGRFEISVRNMDLGISAGIRSVGFLVNPTLAGVSPVGADIHLTLSGNLDVASSQIASFSGGCIDVESALGSSGYMNIGSAYTSVNDATPKGIYTAHGGDVTVHAAGDVLVNGSRIASYDGGNVVVTSGELISSKDGQVVGWSDVAVQANGIYYATDGSGGIIYDKTTTDALGKVVFDTVNGHPVLDANHNPVHGYLVTLTGGKVDAGNGAAGYFYVTTARVDPQSGRVQLNNEKFFGSGIVALTAVNSSARVGDISIAAGGDILAGSGGVLQIPFNHQDQSAAEVILNSAGGSILASDSGILGRNVTLLAKKDITGRIVAVGNVDIHANRNVDVTAQGGHDVTVSGDKSVTGKVVGGDNVSVSGDSVTADAISSRGNVSGNTSGATSAFSGVAAPAAQKTVDDAEKTVASAATIQADDGNEKKKRGTGSAPVLAQKVSRVTVILPKKS